MKVWGGNRIYSSSHIPQLLKAFHDFTENPVDPKAAIILTLEKIGSSEIPFMFYFYDGWKAPKGVFKQFEDIPAQLDGCKSRTYTDLVSVADSQRISSHIYSSKSPERARQQWEV